MADEIRPHLNRVRQRIYAMHGLGLAGVSLPARLILDLTNRCNLRCFMCNAHSAEFAGCGAPGLEMPAEIFDRLTPILAGARIVNLGGCGEPLLANDIESRLERLRSVNPRLYLLTFTNGTPLADPGRAARLLPYFDELHLSLNGVASYEQVMTGSRQETIRRALANIRTVREATGRPRRLVMGFIVMRRNLDDIVPAAELALEYGFDRIQYKHLWVFHPSLQAESIMHDPALAASARERIGRARATGLPLECELWPELNSRLPDNWGLHRPVPAEERPATARPPLLTRAIRMWREDRALFRERLRRFIRAYGRLYSLRALPSLRPPPCDYPWTQVQVFENGDVFLCCEGATRLGNLGRAPFEEIWSGEEARRYRLGMLTGRYHGDCARCKILFPERPAAFEKLAEGRTGS